MNLNVPSITPAEAVEQRFVIVDVRSPREFAEGHVPGALNLPLFDDDQRAVVGLTYKEKGAQRARLAALDLISGGLPDYLRHLALLGREGGRLAVMCWRGGERSRNVVLLLALVGVHAFQAQGGYKAYRRWVLDRLGGWTPGRPVFTVYGETGSGKTAMLRALARLAPDLPPPRPAVIDLEGLALHRGSMLGGLNQPGRRTQKDFDALLWDALRRADGDYLVLEGEGGKIGKIFLPESVAGTIRAGIPVLAIAGREERTRRILQEYSPETWDQEETDRFRHGLSLIARRLPPGLGASLAAALEDGRFPEVVRVLLESYYDPLYRRSSVDGKDFALTLRTGSNPEETAHAFALEAGRIIKEQTPTVRV